MHDAERAPPDDDDDDDDAEDDDDGDDAGDALRRGNVPKGSWQGRVVVKALRSWVRLGR